MPAWKTAPYPAARREEHYDTYASKASGRVSVHDPYRWLETPPSESEETKAFVEAQAAYTRSYLERDPNRQKLKDALTANWNYARFSCPSLKNDDYYYYSFNSGLQAQAVVYRIHKSQLPASIAETEEGPGGELFFDPNRLSTDGTASLASTSFSESGKYLAYGVSRSGSDWTTIYVRKTDTPHKPVSSDDTSVKAEDDGRMSDVVRYAKFTSITWTHDDKGFLYQRYPTKNEHGNDTDDKAGTETGSSENAMLYYHTLGTRQAEDILIMQELSEPSWMYGAEVSDDGRYLILSIFKDTNPSSKTWVCDLTKTDLHAGKDALQWQKIVDEFGAAYSYIANDDTLFYFQTNAQAPKYKMVTFDLAKPKEGFRELVKEDPDSTLTSASVINGNDLLLMRSRDVKDELSIHDLKTGQRKGRIGQNLIGTFGELRGRRHHKELFFKVIGFSNPGLAYRYSFEDEQGEKLFRATVVKGLQQDEFETQQVFYESKDGTRVPMFIVTPRGVPQDDSAPCLLYGYGGFSISMDPFFSPEMLTFCKAYGARLCVANIRGGSEYGEDWHRAGVRERKQNVFDDFQYAAKYLVKEKYTAYKKLAIYGGSNGGLLVAACANQAPELFGCVLSAVGVLDMLRFHKFTIGAAWAGDYSTSDDPEGFDYLYRYSPVHNVRSGTVYPSVMLLTGDHDDRVSPLHSFKFIAALQHQLAENPNPLLLRVALKAGHGAGKSVGQRIEEATDRFSFAATSMGLSFKEPAQAAHM